MTFRPLAWGALALLAGCASPQMKSTPFYEGNDREAYTGAVEDRVNLWPVAYWREPVGSVAWPLLSFSDDQLALRPLYSQYRQNGKTGSWDEFNLCWPIAQADLRDDDYRIFPLFWGGTTNSSYSCVFPVWFDGRKRNGEKGWNALFPLWIANWEKDESSLKVVAGLAGARRRTDGFSSNWCFPLWYWNSKGLFATPLYGETSDSYWLFPLWYRDADTFVSLPISWTGDAEDGGWASPGLLSWGGWEKDGGWNANVLLGTLGAEKRVCEFVYSVEAGKDPDLTTTYTNEVREVWCGPLWKRVASEERKTDNAARTCEHSLLMGLLADFEWTGDALSSAFMLPLFKWNGNGTFVTALGGRDIDRGGNQTNHLYTVLAGSRHGRQTGGWFFPFWNHRKDAAFDELSAHLDASRLQEDCQVRIAAFTNKVGDVSYSRQGEYRYAKDATEWLLLSDDNVCLDFGPFGAWHEDTPPAATNDYRMVRRHKRGNVLVFNQEGERRVVFSSGTREKASDTERDETSLLVWLYESERRHDRTDGDLYEHRRMLWRLWDWERTNDDVSLDVFPGFTYDAKKDGFTKTSLLWRLFRYEDDPQKGVSADLLFLPVWRP